MRFNVLVLITLVFFFVGCQSAQKTNNEDSNNTTQNTSTNSSSSSTSSERTSTNTNTSSSNSSSSNTSTSSNNTVSNKSDEVREKTLAKKNPWYNKLQKMANFYQENENKISNIPTNDASETTLRKLNLIVSDIVTMETRKKSELSSINEMITEMDASDRKALTRLKALESKTVNKFKKEELAKTILYVGEMRVNVDIAEELNVLETESKKLEAYLDAPGQNSGYNFKDSINQVYSNFDSIKRKIRGELEAVTTYVAKVYFE